MNNLAPAILEIKLSALAHNYHFLKSKLRPETKLLGVVKANGYGSESLAIAKKLEVLGIDYLAVAYIQEGIKLRQNGVQVPILVFHAQPEQYKTLIEHCLEPSIYSLRTLAAFIEAAQDCHNYPIHIKTNTGLNRLGFSDKDFKAVLSLLEKQSCVKVIGLFSHLAASDDEKETTHTKGQISLFHKHIKLFESALGNIALKHLLNTSGILNFPEAQLQMARAGIGLYGYSNKPAIDKFLKPVASLRCKISQIHHIEKGEWVGYNKGFVAVEKMRIATITIGHADGISRQYGNGKGVVYIHGHAAPIVGNVCMDMLMINLSNIAAQEGDAVIVFGDVPNKNSSAEHFAAGANTISYELLNAIGNRVQRQIIE